MQRQIQLVIWDESGLAVASAAVAIPAGLADGAGCYDAALQVAHQAELLLLYIAGPADAVTVSEIPAPDPNQLVLL